MIDFNNDALELIVDALVPLVGESVTIDGCLPDGTDYMHGKLVKAEAVNGEPYIEVQRLTNDDYDGSGRASGEIVRLHASEQAHRIRVCQ
jgi:hypothetical protein